MTALLSVVLVGALGLAIDGSQMFAHRQMAQAAADAAAQAGMMSIFRGTNTQGLSPFGTGTPPFMDSQCAVFPLVDNRIPCVYAQDNGFGTIADKVTLTYPASVSGVTLSSAAVPAITVTVQRTLTNGLIRMVGAGATSVITAKATAALVGSASPYSIIVLDGPSYDTKDAFLATNGASLTISGGGGIAVDSGNNSPEAALIYWGSTVTAADMNIYGTGTVTCYANCPVVKTGGPLVPDPFASLPTPAVGACLQGTGMYSPPNNTIIQPGTYCGGITLGNGVSGVTFKTGGVFVISGGGLSFQGGITTSGINVMFYLTSTGGSVNIANGVTVSFSAQTSGPWLGVLFFQNKANTNAFTFAGGANTNLTGSIYVPGAPVSFSNGSSVFGETAIVANTVSFTGGTNFNYDSTGQKTGLFSQSVALVQ